MPPRAIGRGRPGRRALIVPALAGIVAGSSLACRLAAVGLAVGIATAAAPAPAAERPLVLASFYPLYEFARAVAGDRAEVVTLVPPGVEPHDWEPSPQDIVQVQKARLFIYNGAGLEPWVDRLTREVRGGAAAVVKTTEKINLLTGAQPHDHGPKGTQAHAHRAEPDPHVWLDPVRAQAQVEAIRAGLARIDPAGAPVYAANTQAYQARLAALDATFAAGLKQCARRDLVTSHAAFAYLAGRYRLTQVPIQGLTPESEPSAADLAALVRLARQRQVKYVFFETLVNPKLAETLAREVGAKTLVLNPIEGLTREEQAAGKSYLTLMEDNLRNLRTALDCQ
jgi:zinc transport system substrate-binding protein